VGLQKETLGSGSGDHCLTVVTLLPFLSPPTITVTSEMLLCSSGSGHVQTDHTRWLGRNDSEQFNSRCCYFTICQLVPCWITFMHGNLSGNMQNVGFGVLMHLR